MKVEQNDYTWEEHMIESIKKLDKNTPEGSIIDPDTLLADILDEADHEVSGLAREIFEIFKKSADKESIKELFFAFTGVEFNNFLNKCIKETSRKEVKIHTRNTQISYLYKKRQNIVKESMNKIQENYPDDVLANERCIVLYDSSFNEGIIGILAGKLTEKYNVPAFVFTDPIYPKKIGLYKGSGRSARNIHLKNLLDKNKDLLSGYGGHAGAAGLSIDKTKLSQFSQQVNLQLSDIVLSERRCLKYDLEISASEIPYYMDELQKFAPYGEGNPNPVFLIHDFYLSPRNGHFFQRIGQNAEHIKLYGNNMDAIGFDMAERFINNEVPKQIDIIGTLSFNYFNNRKKIQIEIFDYLSIKKEKTPFIESLESLLTL